MFKCSLFIPLGLAIVLVALTNSPTIAQDDQDLQEKVTQGEELIAEAKFSDASKLFREITDANSDFGPAWFYLGYALHMNGDIDEAIKAHTKAAEFDEQTGVASFNLGCAHALKRDNDSAIPALQTAIENDFNEFDKFATDSDLHSLHTDVRFAKLLAKLDGKSDVASTFDEAEEFVGNGEFAKAAEVYSSVLESDEQNAFATYRLGYTLHGAGELDKALEMHHAATKFKGVAPVASYNIGCVHSLKDNKDEAMKALEKAVELGMIELDAYENDPDLENVRSDPRFAKLVAKIKQINDGGHDHEDHDDETHEHDTDKEHDKVGDG